jgi:predicted Zn-dependent peptidase
MDNYKKCIDIIHNVINFPIFKSEELDIERKVVLEEINRRKDADSDLYNLSYLTVLSSDNKYAQPIEGYTSTLNKVTVKDLYAYYKERYGHVVFTINCDERSKEEVHKYVSHKLGPNIVVGSNDISAVYGSLGFQSGILIINQKYQQYTTHIIFPSFPRGMVKENIVLNFVKYCLVSSGLYSILMYQLRSKRGLIYNINATNETYRFLGLFRLVIATSDKNTDHICNIVFDVLQKFATSGIPKKVLGHFKKGYLNEQKYALTNDEFKTILHGESLFYDSDISNQDYVESIQKIIVDDVIEISKRIFDFSKVGILSYGRYPHQTTTEKHLYDLVATYNSLQHVRK